MKKIIITLISLYLVSCSTGLMEPEPYIEPESIRNNHDLVNIDIITSFEQSLKTNSSKHYQSQHTNSPKHRPCNRELTNWNKPTIYFNIKNTGRLDVKYYRIVFRIRDENNQTTSFVSLGSNISIEDTTYGTFTPDVYNTKVVHVDVQCAEVISKPLKY